MSETLVIRGMYGVGDCIHQRAILRDLLDAGDNVVLDTFYYTMYEDLMERGLRLRLIGGVMPRIKDRKQAYLERIGLPIRGAINRRITYDRNSIHRRGSILAAQYACLNMKMPTAPDFSMPVKQEWRDEINGMLPTSDKPLMVYRPSVLNNVWLSEARSPDPRSYAELYEFIRDEFFVVSVANLGDKGERIDGPEMQADVKFHKGELDFELLTGLFAEADVAFTCPGFAPVLSQAVGTSTIIVYGGNESFATTNSVGAHLAPTLPLEPINPCACHLKEHDCDKTMDIPALLKRLSTFVGKQAAFRGLGTLVQDYGMGYGAT